MAKKKNIKKTPGKAAPGMVKVKPPKVFTREDLPGVLYKTLNKMGGEASVVEVASRIWEKHERTLIKSGDLYFTWQHDMRLAATKLRREGKMVPAAESPAGVWQLKPRLS